MSLNRRLLPFSALFLLSLSGLLQVTEVNAARIRDVADAMDEDDPFDANIELQYDLRQHTAVITRENYQTDSDANPPIERIMRVKELAYEGTTHEIMPRLENWIVPRPGPFSQNPDYHGMDPEN